MGVRLASLGLAVLLAGCGSYPVPPPLPQEARPLPPVSDSALVWQPGDWAYDGSYRFVPGRYVPVAGHGPQWLFGHWDGPSTRAVWVPGGWVP